MSIAGGVLTMRAHLKRNINPADGYGTKEGPADMDTTSPAEPCWLWSTNKRLVVVGGKVVTVEELRGVFGGGADIESGDIAATVMDRSGNMIFQNLVIDTVSRKTLGAGHSQIEVTCRKFNG